MTFTIRQFRKQYGTEDKCFDSLLELRYGESGTCGGCRKKTGWHRVAERKCYECQWCGKQIYPMQGTIFEDSHMSLADWFYILYLMTMVTRHGVSAKEVQRQLGCSYKTAWRNCALLRELLGMPKMPRGNLKGHVEIDDHYEGGVRKGKRGRGAAGKTVIMGMVERGGEARSYVVPDVKKRTLMPLIQEHVEEGSRVSTDELRSYGGLGANYQHGVVHHARKQYVSETGDHTQSIEGYWSIFKKSVKSTHIHVSKKHMQKYLNEFSFRYTHRKTPELMFSLALAKLAQAA